LHLSAFVSGDGSGLNEADTGGYNL